MIKVYYITEFDNLVLCTHETETHMYLEGDNFHYTVTKGSVASTWLRKIGVL